MENVEGDSEGKGTKGGRQQAKQDKRRNRECEQEVGKGGSSANTVPAKSQSAPHIYERTLDWHTLSMTATVTTRRLQ